MGLPVVTMWPPFKRSGTNITQRIANDTLVLSSTFTSGGTNDKILSLAATLNDAGAAGGSDYFRGIKMVVTETNVTGWNNTDFISAYGGTLGTTEVFRVTTQGNLFLTSISTIQPNEAILMVDHSNDYTATGNSQSAFLSLDGTFTLTGPSSGASGFFGAYVNLSDVSITNGVGTLQTSAGQFIAVRSANGTGHAALTLGSTQDSNESSHLTAQQQQIFMPGIANGIGAATYRFGLLISGDGTNGNLNLGNQTATLDNFVSLVIDNHSLTSTTLVRTITNASGASINAPTAASNLVEFGTLVSLTLGTEDNTIYQSSADATIGDLLAGGNVVTLGKTTNITTGLIGTAVLMGKTINQSGGAVVVTDAATVFIEGAMTAGASVTLTNNYALWVGSGDSRFDGTVITQNISAPAGSITLTPNTDTLFANGTGVVIGHTAQITTDMAPEFQVLGTAGPDSSGLFGRFSADAFASELQFIKSRNATIGSSTVVQDNDKLGVLGFYAADGTNLATLSARFYAQVDDPTPTTGDVGTEFVWQTMAGGGASLTTKMTLTPAGVLDLAGNYVLRGVGVIGGGVTTPDTDFTLQINRAFTGAAGNAIAHLNLGGGITEASSGTHSTIAGLSIDTLTITDGAGSEVVTNLAALYIEAAPVAGTTPANGPYSIFVDAGASRFDGAIIGNQGTDIASASTIVIPTDGNKFELTGTTAVNLITKTGYQDGHEITLIANESVTINHGTATSGSDITVLLAGASNFSMTANDTLTLALTTTTAGGQAWRELARTAI